MGDKKEHVKEIDIVKNPKKVNINPYVSHQIRNESTNESIVDNSSPYKPSSRPKKKKSTKPRKNNINEIDNPYEI